jgi:transposase
MVSSLPIGVTMRHDSDVVSIKVVNEEETMNKHTIIGFDIAKQVFHLMKIDRSGKQIQRKKLRRSQVLRYFAQQPAAHIAMEACASAHYWARELQALGHSVELLPAQHVKGYARGQKNDYNDARAIAEACLHGSIRPVVVKTVAQQDDQAMHRCRQQLIRERTALCNQLRGLVGEYGIVIPRGVASVRRRFVAILESEALTPRLKTVLQRQYQRLLALDEELAWYDQRLEQLAKEDPVCQRLCASPGYGPVVSTAFKNWLGDGSQFRRGREASAALGVVPRQHTSGDKPLLLGITKCGDRYVRALMIHGARSVVRAAAHKDDALSQWINRLVARRGFNKAAVALANKMIRYGWVIVSRGESYQPRAVSR